MRIVRLDKRSALRVRSNLAQLTTEGSQQFLSVRSVGEFLINQSDLPYSTAKIICNADKAISYVEKFTRSRVPIKRVEHIIALLCIFSQDSLGGGVLSEKFHSKIPTIQRRMDDCYSDGYVEDAVAVEVMNLITSDSLLSGNTYASVYLLYNFFLFKMNVALILEDTDARDSSLLLNMKYKVDRHAQKFRS